MIYEQTSIDLLIYFVVYSFVDDLQTKIALIPLPPRQGFNPRPVYVGFMACKVALGQVP